MAKRSERVALGKSGDIVRFEGEIDLHVSPRIAAVLRERIEKRPASLLVDLSGVTYVDSSGLAVFIEAMQNLQQKGGRFGLIGLQESVRSIFEIARLDQVFQIFPDVAAASLAA